MAELLIKARDANHADAEKDRRGCYKRGDVVLVVEDGHEWGRKEGPPNFVILRIPLAARALAERLADEDDEDDVGAPAVDEKGERRVHRRRRWRVNLEALPAAVRAALQADGRASVTRVQLRARLRRKRDGAPFPDL